MSASFEGLKISFPNVVAIWMFVSRGTNSTQFPKITSNEQMPVLSLPKESMQSAVNCSVFFIIVCVCVWVCVCLSSVSIVIGIPTVKREMQSYLVNTLSSLFYSLTASQWQDLLVIVFVAEVTHTHTHKYIYTLRQAHAQIHTNTCWPSTLEPPPLSFFFGLSIVFNWAGLEAGPWVAAVGSWVGAELEKIESNGQMILTLNIL